MVLFETRYEETMQVDHFRSRAASCVNRLIVGAVSTITMEGRASQIDGKSIAQDSHSRASHIDATSIASATMHATVASKQFSRFRRKYYNKPQDLRHRSRIKLKIIAFCLISLAFGKKSLDAIASCRGS